MGDKAHNPRMRTYIVEDDAELRGALSNLLRQKGFHVESTGRGREAQEVLLLNDFDLAIVDIGLPDIDGLTLIRTLRRHQRGLPILVLTALDAVDNRVTGLDAGADDYLVKPFVMAELEARARALVRRHRADRAQSIKIGPLELTMGQPRILLNGTPVDLTAREFTLLELLAQRAGRVVKKDQIASSLAPSGEALSDTAIEVAVHRLRRRLEPFDLKVQTIRGFGYLLEAMPEQEPDD